VAGVAKPQVTSTGVVAQAFDANGNPIGTNPDGSKSTLDDQTGVNSPLHTLAVNKAQREADAANVLSKQSSPQVVSQQFQKISADDIQSGNSATELEPSMNGAKDLNGLLGSYRGKVAGDANKFATTIGTVLGIPIDPKMSESQATQAIGNEINSQIISAGAGKLGGAAFDKGGQFDLTGNSQAANEIQLDWAKQKIAAQKQVAKLATEAANDPEKQATYQDDKAKALSAIQLHVPLNGKMVSIADYKKSDFMKKYAGQTIKDKNGKTITVPAAEGQ
jgi:hypothetical protein